MCLLASYGERFLGDPWFDPLFDELNAREAVVFLHPNFHPSSRGLKLVAPAFMVEFLFDTTRAVVNMLVSGTFERYPRIRFMLAHAGATLPLVADRVSMFSRFLAPDVDVLALDRALDALAAVDERKSRVIELRFFGGLSVEEAAEVLHVSTDTIKRDWRLAKLWLLRELEGTRVAPRS